MSESKRKHLAAAAGFKSNTNALDNSSNGFADSYLLGEDDWIVVKKQRINILIPRLPDAEQCDLEQHQPCGDMSSNINTPELLQESPQTIHFTERNDADDEGNGLAIPKPRSPDFRRMITEDQTEASRAFAGRPKNLLKFQKTSPKLVRSLMQSGLYGVCHLPTSSISLNRKMRALNLERKISNAGGLDSWLSSLGLEQFVGILGAKHVSKFHLANLSMKKLKDMGVHAVGPRRKLIHAIECVCPPYYEPFDLSNACAAAVKVFRQFYQSSCIGKYRYSLHPIFFAPRPHFLREFFGAKKNGRR